MDVDFKPTGESPLVGSKEFNNVKCPKCEQPARRESDTIDTFIDSSWYYLRYTDPYNVNEFASRENIEKRCPVDVYVGGAEHAVLHLLYARFIAKVLADGKFINFREPFLKLKNQGLIMAEDGRKMSKSLGNVVNPDDVIKQYGADTLRVYEMFMGPFNDAKPWSTAGIIGSYRFLQKIYKIGQETIFAKVAEEVTSRNLEKTKHKVSEDIVGFNFNTAISAMMEFVKYLDPKLLTREQWEKFLIILSPFAPHLTQELWDSLYPNQLIDNQAWVSIDKNLLEDDHFDLPVQINGKVRTVISISKTASESQIKEIILNNEIIKKSIDNRPVKKIIVVPLKITNIIC
jgi:leucyl-tRNA synthetase